MKKLISLLTMLHLVVCIAQQPGSFDDTFNVGSGTQVYHDNYYDYGNIYSSALLPDGKIAMVGRFTYFNGNTVSKILRLNADGSYDNTFNSSGTGFDSNLAWNSQYIPYKIFAQEDGKMLIAGNFRSYNGISKRVLIRLNTDGSIDNSFYFHFTPLYEYNYESTVSTLLILPNGKMLVGGTFGEYISGNLVVQKKVIRINSDGSLDATFNNQIEYDGYINDIKVQTDGKIVVAGAFNNIGNFWSPKLVRLTSDGNVDTSFIIYTGFNSSPAQIEIASDGSIFAAGSFTTFDNIPVQRIVKLLPSGYLDFSFTLGAPEIAFNNGSNGGSKKFILMSDEKLFLFGAITFNGVWRYNAGMFNADGSFDDSFLNGFDNFIDGGFQQPDGKIVCFGAFLSYDGHSAKRLVRINGSTLSNTDFHHDAIAVYPNPASNFLNIETANDLIIDKLVLIDVTGKIISIHTENTNQIDTRDLSTGIYFLQAYSGDKKLNIKFIKQ